MANVIENRQAETERTKLKTEANWEHENLAQVRVKVLRGHTNEVKSCQFCYEDTKLLTASHDKTIRLWDFQTGDVLQTYDGHRSAVSQAKCNANTNRLVSVGWDKQVCLWDSESGSVLWKGRHAGIATCCGFSTDGKCVVTGSDMVNDLKIWDTNTGECIKTLHGIHTSTITSCMFSLEGDRLITTSMDRTTKFYDLKSCKVTIVLKGHTNVISDAALSLDERNLATVSWDKNIAFWDISTGMYRSGGPQLVSCAHDGCVAACNFSSDGMTLATCGYDCTLALWDLAGEKPSLKLRLQGHRDWVEDVSCSGDGNWLLSCSKDTTVRLWNIRDTDKIPQVLENRKTHGLKMYKCSLCGKPFSVTQLENPKDIDLCVFCRLQRPQRHLYDFPSIISED